MRLPIYDLRFTIYDLESERALRGEAERGGKTPPGGG